MTRLLRFIWTGEWRVHPGMADCIANQALKIEAQDKVIREYREACRKIVVTLVCIGGPLNDNVLGYSREQMLPLFRILQAAEGVEDVQ